MSLTPSRDPYQCVIFFNGENKLKKFPWSRQQLITLQASFPSTHVYVNFFFLFNSKTGFGNINCCFFFFRQLLSARGVYFERFMFYSFGLLSGKNWKLLKSMTGLSLIAWGKGELINAVYGSIFVSVKIRPRRFFKAAFYCVTAANRVMLRCYVV